ncbi:hypothetical protein FQZ97_539510 [compost metagenome]
MSSARDVHLFLQSDRKDLSYIQVSRGFPKIASNPSECSCMSALLLSAPAMTKQTRTRFLEGDGAGGDRG